MFSLNYCINTFLRLQSYALFSLYPNFTLAFASAFASTFASTFHDFSRHISHEWHECSRSSQVSGTILLCTKDTNITIFASERHDASLHERHEYHDFRKRKTRFFFARKTRFSHFDKIVLSACRHCIIRVIRAKNRVIGLPISYHSCLSCYKRVLNNRAIGLPISCHSCVIIGIGMDFLIM